MPGPVPGQTFQPRTVGNGDEQNNRTTPVQEAVKMLSLRLPTIQAQRGIAPQALLQAQGAGGLQGPGGGDALIQMLRRLMQASGAQAPTAVQSMGGPSPLNAMLPPAPSRQASPAQTNFPTPRIVADAPKSSTIKPPAQQAVTTAPVQTRPTQPAPRPVYDNEYDAY